ncbi:MAG: glycosyl transferase [Acidobacteria bacterium]|nr:MAG: glycosyl transferase [Acidobacteriota bacterium]
METPVPDSGRPTVSVIVPARNEEASLRVCLESLSAQRDIHFEIIVVDDGSTDRTRAIAESFPGIRVIEPGPLPPGWTGKNNAVTAGAREAQGRWLLFTDADTVHKTGSLARAVAESEQHHVDLLSYSPEQEVRGFWEKAGMPVIFAELARKYPPSRISDPSSKLAAANGQYLLITRSAYDAVGGHAAVAQSLLEDVALARAARNASFKIRFRYGGDAVRTRMYRGFRQMREGWTKNLSLLFPNAASLALWRALEFAAVMACFTMVVLSALAHDWRHVPFYLILPLMTVLRIAPAHFSWSSNLLGILGLPFFSYLLLRSKLRHASGTVAWKGRTYPGSAGIKLIS